ncbi:MAG: hypothetical protein ACRC1H_14560, partial [Caldilineaceae bacterium]
MADQLRPNDSALWRRVAGGALLAVCLCLASGWPAALGQTEDPDANPAGTPVGEATPAPEGVTAAEPGAMIETPTALPGLLVQPAALRFGAFRNEVESRRLLLRDPLANGVQFLAQDLPNGAGDEVLPADALALTVPATATTVNPGDTVGAGVPLAVDLTVSIGDARSGRYTGQALLVGGGAEAAVTLEVSVKDRPWWPLITLLLGVVAGMAITWYRQQLGPRDRLLVAVDDLLREADRDDLLRSDGRAAAFRQRIDLHAGDAGAAIRSGAFEGAQRHLALGRRTLDLWRRERPGWLQALDRRDALASQLGALDAEPAETSAFVRDLQAGLEIALPGLLEQAVSGPLAEESGALAPRYDNALRTISEWAARYAAFGARAEEVRAMLQSAPPADAQPMRAALAELEELYAAMRPLSVGDDAAQANVMAGELRKLAAAAQALADAETQELAGPPRPTIEQTPEPTAAPWRPLDAALSEPQRVAQARLRNWVAWGLGFVVAAGLLGGAGFQELYVDNPIFGARRWFDYFTLLAWGLGAEA